jgi:hypothetical protein
MQDGVIIIIVVAGDAVASTKIGAGVTVVVDR